MKRIGLVANVTKPLFWEQLPQLLKGLAGNDVTVFISDAIAAEAGDPSLFNHLQVLPNDRLPETCDIILAVGGDGTILRTVNLVGEKETPVLGINVGGLGFLTEIPLETFTEEFSHILSGNYRLEKRIMLRADISGETNPVFALNELVLDKGVSVRVIMVEVLVDGHFLNAYVADGLLISTPTGSTGYSLSAGGPIVVPSTEALIINPICPHSLTNRPVIIPADARIETVTRTESPDFIVSLDGQQAINCPTRTRVVIQKADFYANLVKPRESSFFDLLHNKLNLGKDFRDKNRWSHNS